MSLSAQPCARCRSGELRGSPTFVPAPTFVPDLVSIGMAGDYRCRCTVCNSWWHATEERAGWEWGILGAPRKPKPPPRPVPCDRCRYQHMKAGPAEEGDFEYAGDAGHYRCRCTQCTTWWDATRGEPRWSWSAIDAPTEALRLEPATPRVRAEVSAGYECPSCGSTVISICPRCGYR